MAACAGGGGRGGAEDLTGTPHRALGGPADSPTDNGGWWVGGGRGGGAAVGREIRWAPLRRSVPSGHPWHCVMLWAALLPLHMRMGQERSCAGKEWSCTVQHDGSARLWP